MVIPEGHDEDHATGKSVGHLFHSTLGSVVILIAEDVLDVTAHVVIDRLVGLRLARNSGVRVVDLLAVLHEEALDFDNV